MTTCRTPEDAYQAGWQTAATAPPLTREQATRIALTIAASTTKAAA